MSTQSLLRNFLSLGIVQIANYVFPFISLPIISRILGPEKFGIINYAGAFIAYFNLLIGYGFDFTATRKLAKNPNDQSLKSVVFSEVLCAKILLFLLSVFIFIICLYTVPLLAGEKKVSIFTFILCIAAVLTQNWLFQALQELPKVAVLNFISKSVFTIAVLYIIRNRSDYVWYPLIFSFAQLLVAILSIWWAIKRFKLVFYFIPITRLLHLLWEERIIFFTTIVISLYTITNIVVLGQLGEPIDVGYYTAGQKLIDIVNSILNVPLSQALFPFIGVAFSNGIQKGTETVQKILPIVVILTGLIGIGVLICGPTILVWFYGQQFAPSISVFQILSFLPLVVALSNIFGIQIMLNLNMDKAFFRTTFIGAVIGFGLNILMVLLLGYQGTAWSWMIVEVFITVTLYIQLRRKGINPVKSNNFKLSEIKQQMLSIIRKFKKF